MATGTAVNTGDIITAAKMNLKQETGVSLANLSVVDQSGAGSQALAVVVTETLTAGRNLTITVNDAARTIDLTGNLTLAAAFTTSGAFGLTLTQTALTNVTLPKTGTLATLAGSESLTNKTITSAVMSGTMTGAHTYSGILTLTAASMVLTAGAAFTLGTSDANSLIINTNNANRWAFTSTIGQFTVYQTTFNYTLAFSDPAAARTVTFPDPGGNDSVTYIAATQTLTNKTITAAALSGTFTGTPTFSGNLIFTGSLTVNGTNIDTIVQDISPHIDIGLDVFATGTVIDIAYDSAETLTGALIGISVDLDTNVTLSGQNVTGLNIVMPATYGVGAEYGIQITGDGQTIRIGQDADLYISLAKASTVDINFQGVSPVIDIGADVFESGTFIDIVYDTAETLTGAVIGINLNLNSNVTPSGQNVNGIILTMPATYGAGAEVGIQVLGDGQTINIGNDADLYISLAKASTVDINIQGVSPVVDIGADVFASGTFIDVAYDTAETLTGATIGLNIDLGTNVTSMGAAEGNLTAIHVDLGPLTLAAAFNGTVYGFHLEADPTLTDENITGVLVTMSATFGSGTDIGISVTGDGQTINIVNDADLYISMAKASTVDINFQGISPVIDIGADVLENGVIVDIDYDTAETLTGTSLIGVDINFNTNLTYATDVDVIGYQFQTAALTQSAANTTLIAGFRVNTAGALVQDTLAGVINWRGVDIQLPNSTQTTGTVTVAGIAVTEGTTTSGTVVGAWLDVDIAIDLVTIGNRIDLDADNDTSLRASGDDILMWEVAGTDFMQWRLDGGVATLVVQAGTAVEIAFAVVNTALTVGTSGSMVIPYLSTTGAAFTDAIGGDVNGAIGINYDSDTGPTSTLEVRSNGAWVSVAVSGYVMQSRVPWMLDSQFLAHGAQVYQSEGRTWIDESRCYICGEPMEPGDQATFWVNGRYERGVHAIFGHAHLERDVYVSSLAERLEAVEEAERILAESDLLGRVEALERQVRELGAVPVA